MVMFNSLVLSHNENSTDFCCLFTEKTVLTPMQVMFLSCIHCMILFFSILASISCKNGTNNKLLYKENYQS